MELTRSLHEDIEKKFDLFSTAMEALVRSTLADVPGYFLPGLTLGGVVFGGPCLVDGVLVLGLPW